MSVFAAYKPARIATNQATQTSIWIEYKKTIARQTTKAIHTRANGVFDKMRHFARLSTSATWPGEL